MTRKRGQADQISRTNHNVSGLSQLVKRIFELRIIFRVHAQRFGQLRQPLREISVVLEQFDYLFLVYFRHLCFS